MGSDARWNSTYERIFRYYFLWNIYCMIQISLNGTLNAQGDTKSYRNVLIFSFFLKYFFKSSYLYGVMDLFQHLV